MAIEAKIQRTPSGELLGACIMLGAENLSFLKHNAEYVTVEMIPTKKGLSIVVKEAEPCDIMTSPNSEERGGSHCAPLVKEIADNRISLGAKGRIT